MDITIGDLNALDEIRIQTWNSEYYFLVTEPVSCKGILTGGIFGQEQHVAIFTGTIIQEPLQIQGSTKLGVGECAMFCVTIEHRMRRLKTSKIVDLSLTSSRD
ncbi:MAG TPA: hypothetical protein VLB68_29140 [Pyrinomonadaceae bacterium]|nr:hypothetical protein [Pyrinomonadaceae bacterium]